MKIQVSYLAFYLAVVVAVAMLLQETTLTHAATCDPTALSPCAAAFQMKAPPSTICCAKLKEQKPCLCGYVRNPKFKPYLSAAKKITGACHVSIIC
ncbi:hypothetical protein Nepgr_029057 [Nepenthes gracilis]|uniref:Bifunctional inhibitor/plant lipid transfer protein/seed storage helical domain-containing protein n=1 Tax=Nepenthes gracilis TaxID=150966 RepID=A0AAD3TE23_NEPGR|nr:hypothetical protein Nepgr_029057 [Nepenthes gracilis]